MTSGAPEAGRLIMVRGRPATIRESKPFQSPGAHTHHLVRVDYIDEYEFPKDDTLVWELEPSKEFLEHTRWPKLRDDAPDEGMEYMAYLDAVRWSSLQSMMGIIQKDDDTPLVSPWSASVQVEDYQLIPVLRALSMPRVNLLLADDVGLGKTIQAGLITSEMMARRNTRRVLIVCPASLQNQWQQEMQEKFHLGFTVLDSQEVLRIRNEHGSDVNPWNLMNRVIVSMDYLKQDIVLTEWLANCDARNDQSPPGQRAWDLLIVDEAHNLAPQGFTQRSDRTRMLADIRQHFDHSLFLTATPHNGYAKNFTGLLELLDPFRFTQHGFLTDSDRGHLDAVMVRRLKTDIDKQSSKKRFAQRRLNRMNFQYKPEEEALFQAIRDYRDAAKETFVGKDKGKANLARFAISLLQKRLFSGLYAFARTWYVHCQSSATTLEEARASQTRLSSDIEDDAEIESRNLDAARSSGGWLAREAPHLKPERDRISTILGQLGFDESVLSVDADAFVSATDSKADAVIAHLQKGLKSGQTKWDALIGPKKARTGQRVLLFTEYRDTQRYLAARLLKYCLKENELSELYGGMNRQQRDDIKQVFNDPQNEVAVLIGTDAASEGLNLQGHCSIIQHYDVPWNPMRLEQRNGRVDRHGQPQPFVDIYHYHSTQIDEERFLDKVVAKIHTIRADLGIVGDVLDESIGHAMHGDELRQDELDALVEEMRSMGNRDEFKVAPVEEAEYKEAMRRFRRSSQAHGLTPENLQRLITAYVRRQLNADVRAARDSKGNIVPGIEIRDAKGRAKTLLEQGIIRKGQLPRLVFDGNEFIEAIGNDRYVFRQTSDKALVRLGTPLTQAAISHYRSQVWGHHREKNLNRWTLQTHREDQDVYIGIDYAITTRNQLQEVLDAKVDTWWYRWTASGWVQLDGGAQPQANKAIDDTPTRSQWMERVGSSAEAQFEHVESRIQAHVKEIHDSMQDALAKAKDKRGEQVNREFQERKKELKREGTTHEQRLREELEKLRSSPTQVILAGGETKYSEVARRIREEKLKALEEKLTDKSLRRWRNNRDALLKRLELEQERYNKHVHPYRFAIAGEPEFLRVGVRVLIPEGGA